MDPEAGCPFRTRGCCEVHAQPSGCWWGRLPLVSLSSVHHSVPCNWLSFSMCVMVGQMLGGSPQTRGARGVERRQPEREGPGCWLLG